MNPVPAVFRIMLSGAIIYFFSADSFDISIFFQNMSFISKLSDDEIHIIALFQMKRKQNNIETDHNILNISRIEYIIL